MVRPYTKMIQSHTKREEESAMFTLQVSRKYNAYSLTVVNEENGQMSMDLNFLSLEDLWATLLFSCRWLTGAGAEYVITGA